MSTESNDKKDELIYLYSVLKRLGCGDVETFNDRLISQKTQYFAQLFGATYRYKYNLYIRGPYSPELARDLFAIKEEREKGTIKPMLDKFIPEELEKRFNDLKRYIKNMVPKQLEIVATYHWLLKVAKFPEAKAKEKLIEFKGANENEINYAISKLNEYAKIKESYN